MLANEAHRELYRVPIYKKGLSVENFTSIVLTESVPELWKGLATFLRKISFQETISSYGRIWSRAEERFDQMFGPTKGTPTLLVLG